MPSYQQYRISRTLPNGWKIRLDFIPYDVGLGSTLNNPISELDEVCLLELGDHTAEYDAVPYGLCKPHTLKFKLGWSRLPSAVQDALETGYDGKRTNLWLFYSDRGTNGVTYTLEFAGCEDNVESLELEPLDGGDYAYNVELVDIAYHAMKTTTGEDAVGGKIGTDRIANRTPWQMFMEYQRGRNQSHEVLGDLFVDNTQAVMEYVLEGMGVSLINNYVHHTVQITDPPSEDVADYTSTMRNVFVAALELYGCSTGEPTNVPPLRAKRTPDYSYPNTNANDSVRPLLSTELYLTVGASLKQNSSDYVGGIYSKYDNYGWGRKDLSLYDLIRDLCETLGVKASYKFTYYVKTGGLTTDRILVTWYVKRVASSRDWANDVDTTDVSVSLDGALASPKITKRGDNILKSEVRYETSNQEDKTELVRVTAGARASRSMNVEPIVHNIPVFLRDFDERRGRYEAFKQTNHIYFKGRGVGQRLDGTTVIKVHEDTVYWYGPKATQYVSVSSTASNNPEYQDDESQQKYSVQLAALQAETSMGVALTKFHLKCFSDNNNAIAEVEWAMTNVGFPEYFLPTGLAGRHTLTGDVTTTFATLPWAYALPCSIKANYVEGKISIKYYLFSPTTAG